MTSQEVNIILVGIIITLACGFLLLRESPQALDALADWAQSRSWGLKCAEAEREKRLKNRNQEQQV